MKLLKMSPAHINPLLLTLCLLLHSVSSQMVPSTCVIQREMEKCMEMMASHDPGEETELVCPWMWDNLTCWAPAKLGEVAEVNCPELFYQFIEEEYEPGKVSRNCTEFGWSETFPHYYDACYYEEANSTHPDMYFVSVKALYTVGYSTSLVSLVMAMVILCRFRKLHCTRNFIHMNLFVSFILRAISVFIKDGVLYAKEDSEHCFIHTLECRAVMIFFHYCVLSNYFWLFIEGLYLFTLLVETFFPERRYFCWYIGIGWGAPTICVTIWAVLRIHFDDIGCWDMNDNAAIWWVIKGPVLASIMINFVLFVGIIVILVQKLQSPDIGGNESSIYLRLARSTLLLIPLFGIHYTVFAFSPENVSKRERLVFELGLGSFQGFVVAVLYCFLNGEYIPQGAIGDQEEMAQLDGEQVLCCGPEAPASFPSEQWSERGNAALHPQQEQLPDPHVQPAGRNPCLLSPETPSGINPCIPRPETLSNKNPCILSEATPTLKNLDISSNGPENAKPSTTTPVPNNNPCILSGGTPSGNNPCILNEATPSGKNLEGPDTAKPSIPTMVPMTSLEDPYLNPYPNPYPDDTMMETQLNSNSNSNDQEQPLV